MYVYMYLCMYVCMHVYIYIYIYACIYVYMCTVYICMYTCIYVCIFYRCMHICTFIIWLTDSRAVIGQFQVCKYPYRPLPLDHLLKRQMISFFSQNNQQSHIINIILALFARSVWQVIDPCFFLPCFHGPCASCLGHRRKEKIICQTDLALC